MIQEEICELIDLALAEDIGDGDHSSLACIPPGSMGKARLVIKEPGIIAGIEIAGYVFSRIDKKIELSECINDGSRIKPGDTGFYVEGPVHALLQSERLVLNIIQRMSGIATTTGKYVDAVSDYKAKILDTRKTTPGLRAIEKEAVRIGGGVNHRMGLFDMIILKDNHIDYAGGIKNAIIKANKYLERTRKNLPVVIEAREMHELRQILEQGMVNRIMLDNFSIYETEKAVELIDGRYEIESSGGITLETVRSYARCGVDYISVGALTHHIKSLDISLKAI
ncbi:MAG TPA: carboxylating nicotinate-nucleotide diphosphorylase [Bacteroidales bacterium]|nr:carboxylating nicotinate-nucleotide diphosphorylase [Bacteroidales bacterium]